MHAFMILSSHHHIATFIGHALSAILSLRYVALGYLVDMILRNAVFPLS